MTAGQAGAGVSLPWGQSHSAGTQGDQSRSRDSDLLQSRVQIVRQADREETGLRSSQEVQICMTGSGSGSMGYMAGHGYGCRVAQAVTKDARPSLKADPK